MNDETDYVLPDQFGVSHKKLLQLLVEKDAQLCYANGAPIESADRAIEVNRAVMDCLEAGYEAPNHVSIVRNPSASPKAAEASRVYESFVPLGPAADEDDDLDILGDREPGQGDDFKGPG